MLYDASVQLQPGVKRVKVLYFSLLLQSPVFVRAIHHSDSTFSSTSNTSPSPVLLNQVIRVSTDCFRGANVHIYHIMCHHVVLRSGGYLIFLWDHYAPLS